MSNRYFFRKGLLTLIIGHVSAYAPAAAAPITWVAQGTNSDMEVPSNWNPSTVPTAGDNAIFDSTVPGVNTTPLEQTLDFSCSSFQFPQNASVFDITIENHQLIFDGVGITGAQTNATVESTNTDNASFINNQIFFNGVNSSSGSASLILTNSANITGAGSTTRSIIDRQIYSPNPFTMGNNGSFNLSNSGSDSSSGSGGDISAGVLQGQVVFGNTCTIADHATLSIFNSGTNTSSSSGINQVGSVLEHQLFGASAFQTGDVFNLTISNMGTDSSTGAGNHQVATISTNSTAGLQMEMAQTCTLGDQATINVVNNGTSNGSNSGGGPNVALINQEQVRFRNVFNAGDLLSFSVSNIGFDSGQGIGNDRVADCGGAQLRFDSSCIVGNRASFTLSNFGFFTGTSSNTGNIVGAIGNEQLLFDGNFHAGNNFSLHTTNTGINLGQSTGGSFIGTVTNDAQVQFSGATVGNDASIHIENTGINASSSNNHFVGFIQDQQVCFGSLITTGNNFNLEVSNTGLADTTGSGNFVGLVNLSQVQFNNGCVLGENAKISVSNTGNYSNATGTANSVGSITGFQVSVVGAFTAGKNLNLSVTNSAINTGNPSNDVGIVHGSQLFFNDACNLNDRSLLFASNSGTVSGSQITFNEGFNILSGKATIQVHNEGSVGSNGITVDGNSLGGNVNIILENSSLDIDTALPTFTIGELNGDATSFVQSRPELIIDTDSLTNGLFAGAIQNFPATNSALLKQGPGTQKLSGINTFTGLTTINAGTLILTGSLAGSVNINSSGILKGTGTIGGNVINAGTIAPGESIGTLTILGNYVNNNGTYDVEVNSLGQSDLIHIAGTAALNGGLVVVSSTDGSFRFQQPYTILTADAGVTGTFTGATSLAFITPILTYDPNNVFLTIQSAISGAAESCNQIGVAQNLDGILNPSETQSLLLNALVNLPLEAAQEALESLSGYQYANDVWVTEIATRRFLRRLYDPLRSIVSPRCGCCNDCDEQNCEWTGWLETGGGTSNLRSSRQTPALHMSSFEVTGGLQRSLCCDLTVGLAGSYEYDHVRYSHNGKSNRNSEFVALYGLYRPCIVYGFADFVYGHTSNHLSRAIQVGLLRYKTHSKPNSSQFTFYGEVGFDWRLEGFLIQPFFGIQSGKNWRKQVRENGRTGWELAVQQHRWSATSSRLGVHATTNNCCDCIDMSLDLAWNQLLSSPRNNGTARFTEFGTPFQICGTQIGRSSIDYALTLTISPCNCMKTYLEFSGETWKHASTFDITAGIEFTW